MRAFVAYARTCKDEKGEAQVFCERLFKAFGHRGYKEAGAVLEERVKMEDGRTKFADLVWKPRVLIEMKKRGEKLARHYTQALQYWMRLTPNRPRYVVLCNFDEFWIYDFSTQMDEPMDRLTLDEFVDRYPALNFLFPEEHEPLFRNNRAAVTDVAATKIGGLFRTLVARGEPRERAQRFTLQCVVAMFSEDTGLLPRGLFTELVKECLKGSSSYDLIGALFAQMNREERARAGRLKHVRYFNGGIFKTVDPIDLKGDELAVLDDACQEKWSRINPAIFGTLFQESMEGKERHQKGAHYTPETEIMRVVLPTIVQPWQSRIRKAESVRELLEIRSALTTFRVLDPACGSGNFLYVAYRELKRLELSIIERVHEEYKEAARLKMGAATTIQTKQFFGIDNDRFAVELAKVTLVLAKKLAFDEAQHALKDSRLGLDFDAPLPLENLDENVTFDDALFCKWPPTDVIIGNPPYQSKNKAQGELSPAYMQRVRARYPEVPGHADYCVYWFRRAHDELPDGGRAGLVGTNTIRQNYSRVGGLDHIVGDGGTITDAVSTQVWRGRAVVHVSIANWIKGKAKGPFRITQQLGDNLDSPWKEEWVPRIPSSLSASFDVASAQPLTVNVDSGACYQGLTHGHEDFLIGRDEARLLVATRKENAEVLLPYLNGDELLSGMTPKDWRYVIDFAPRDQVAARRYEELFEHVESHVLPTRKKAAQEERERNDELHADNPKAKGNRHHEGFLKRWWLLSYPRGELVEKLSTLSQRYIVCGRVTKRPVFEFISTRIRPNDMLAVFPLEDDYSFGIFQSGIHWAWFTARCSTLKREPRYTSNTVFDSFAWPQEPSKAQVLAVAKAAVEVRRTRTRLINENDLCLRTLYAQLDQPGEHPLRTANEKLDQAVRAASAWARRRTLSRSSSTSTRNAASGKRPSGRFRGLACRTSAPPKTSPRTTA
jgi:SAM-dependent methyltransferase